MLIKLPRVGGRGPAFCSARKRVRCLFVCEFGTCQLDSVRACWRDSPLEPLSSCVWEAFFGLGRLPGYLTEALEMHFWFSQKLKVTF